LTNRSLVFFALAGLAPLLAGPVLAQGEKISSPVELARQAEQLKPGQWVWAPQISPQGPLLVFVDLSKQLATVYRNGVRIGVTTVSTGNPGYETPTGVFTILQKDATHHSSKYHHAPMPFQQRLTWYGVALHAGGLPGYPESHGCVHLPYASPGRCSRPPATRPPSSRSPVREHDFNILFVAQPILRHG